MTKQIRLRVVVLREDGWLVAQCLEHNIAVQAQSFDALRVALEEAIAGHIVLDLQAGIEPLSNLAAAPARYFELFESAPRLAEVLHPVELDGQAPQFETELRMVAAA